jgi:hypothetical protein
MEEESLPNHLNRRVNPDFCRFCQVFAQVEPIYRLGGGEHVFWQIL